MAPNRKQRASIAKETLQIIEAKKYNDVNLEEALERSVKNSRLFTTSELNLLRMNGQLLEDGGGKFATEIQVTDELSIECCLRLKKENPNSKIGCLNFASAKNPCGGMFSGALAQEESLGLCSTLYPTLIQFKVGMQRLYALTYAYCMIVERLLRGEQEESEARFLPRRVNLEPRSANHPGG